MSKRYRLRSRHVDGNPNIQYVYREEESSEEVEQIGEPTPEAPEAPEPPVKKTKTEKYPEVELYKEQLKQTLYFAMQPLYIFIGQVEAHLGGQDVRYHYQWKNGASLYDRMIPFNDGNYTSIEEVRRANPQLGFVVPELVEIKVKKEKVDQPTQTPTQAARNRRQFKQTTFEGDVDESSDLEGVQIASRLFQLIGPPLDAYSPPQTSAEAQELLRRLNFLEAGDVDVEYWILQNMPDTFIRYVLSWSTSGAIENATAFVRRESGNSYLSSLDLLLSDDVKDKFAELTAHLMLTSSGGIAYPATVQDGGRRRYHVSAGLRQHDRMAQDTLGFRYFFGASFVRINNPRALRLQRMIDDLVQRISRIGDANAADREARRSLEIQVARLVIEKHTLPQFSLRRVSRRRPSRY